MNPERLRKLREWQAAHPEKVRGYQRKYRQANREKIRESRRRWRKANPEKMREYNRRYAPYRKAWYAARPHVPSPKIPPTPEQLARRRLARAAVIARAFARRMESLRIMRLEKANAIFGERGAHAMRSFLAAVISSRNMRLSAAGLVYALGLNGPEETQTWLARRLGVTRAAISKEKCKWALRVEGAVELR